MSSPQTARHCGSLRAAVHPAMRTETCAAWAEKGKKQSEGQKYCSQYRFIYKRNYWDAKTQLCLSVTEPLYCFSYLETEINVLWECVCDLVCELPLFPKMQLFIYYPSSWLSSGRTHTEYTTGDNKGCHVTWTGPCCVAALSHSSLLCSKNMMHCCCCCTHRQIGPKHLSVGVHMDMLREKETRGWWLLCCYITTGSLT